MRYANKALCDALNDQSQTVRMAEMFLAKMRQEVEPTDDHAIDELYREAASAHVKRQIGIIWSTAESPIERILTSPLLMNFLRNHDPFGLVLTRAMAHAPRDMDDIRDGIRELKAAIETREREGGKMSPDALIHDLDAARQSTRLDEWQYDLNLHGLFQQSRQR